MNTPIKMVVFDMAGTTVDEGKTVYKSVQKALQEWGLEISLEQVLEIGGWSKKEGIRHLLKKYAEEGIEEEVVESVHDRFLTLVEDAYRTGKGIREMKGTSEVFQQLKSQGIKVVLDTGYFRPTANLLIEHMGWSRQDLIDYSVTSDEVEKGRPHPFMIHKAMEQLGIEDPKSVAKVGDTISDIQEGHNSGCGMVIAITSGVVSEAELKKHNPSHVIRELPEMLSFIS